MLSPNIILLFDLYFATSTILAFLNPLRVPLAHAAFCIGLLSSLFTYITILCHRSFYKDIYMTTTPVYNKLFVALFERQFCTTGRFLFSKVFCRQSRVATTQATCHSTRIKSELQIHIFISIFPLNSKFYLYAALKSLQIQIQVDLSLVISCSVHFYSFHTNKDLSENK